MGTTTTSCPAPPFSRDTSASAAALPMAVVGTDVVVNRFGRIEAASVASTTGEVYEDTESRDPYTLVNLGGNWRINDTGSLWLAADNLFDADVQVSETGTGVKGLAPPRTVSIGVRLGY